MSCISHKSDLGNEIEVDEMGGECGMYGGEEECVLGVEGKRILGTTMYSWEDNIKMDLNEGWMVCTGFMWLSTGTSGRFL
jgi:hypothetical protein